MPRLFPSQKNPVTFHFVKDGGSLGALGAMLTKPKEATEEKPASEETQATEETPATEEKPAE